MNAFLRSCAPLTALLLAAASAAAQFSAPHILPGDVGPAPAAGDQREVALARGNGQSLMVWEDTRLLQTGTLPDPLATYGIGMLCAARLDANGALIDASPIVVRRGPARAIAPRVAWNGAQYLVAWTEHVSHGSQVDKAVFAARVAPSGQLLDDPPLLIEDQSFVQDFGAVVASAGADWLVAWSGIAGGNDAIRGRIVGANGALGPATNLMTATSGFYFPTNFELAGANGRYLFVSEHYPVGGSGQRTFGQVFDASLAKVGGEFELGLGAGNGSHPFAAASPNGFCAVWTSNFGIRATPVSSNGSVVVPGGADLSGALYVAYQRPSVAWDGQGWTVVFASVSGTTSTVNASRLATNGTVLTGSPIVVSQGNWTMEMPACAAVQNGAQLVWADARNVSTQFQVDRFDLVAATIDGSGTPSAPLDLSLSAPAQVEVDLAGDANTGYLVVFTSQTQGTATIAAQRVNASGVALDVQPIVVASGTRALRNPSVAWNGANWMVAWEEADSPAPRVQFRRVAPNGTFLDASPTFVMLGTGPDVAAAAGDYLVVASHAAISHLRYVYTARVRGSDGAVLDPVAVQQTISYASQPTVAGFGDHWLVAYAHAVTHDAPYATIRFMTVDLGGSASQPAVGGDGGFSNSEPSLASDGNQALLAWSSGGDVRARRIAAGGVKLDSDAGSVISNANNKQFQPAVGWNGTDFVVAYTDYRAIVDLLEIGEGDAYACRVSPAGVVLDPSGLVLANASHLPEGRAAVAGGAGMALVAFSRFDAAAPFGNCRIVLEASSAPLSTYCTAKTNSLGCVPAIGWTGAPQAGASSGFTITASNVRNQTSGILLYGLSGPNALPFHGGTMCVKVPVRRTPLKTSGGSAGGVDCTGIFALDFNAFAAGLGGGSPDPALSQTGTSVHAQWWGRDQGFAWPDNVLLTDGLRFSM